MGITFSQNIDQTDILQNNPYVNCGLVWESDHLHSCPAGAIPYDTYSCGGFTQYNCTNPDPSQCPRIANVTFQGARFYSSTYTNGSATLTCNYSYFPNYITETSVQECYSSFGNNNEACNIMQGYLCTFTNSNLSLPACKDYCTNNYCSNIDSYCTGENLNNPTCQHHKLF